MVKRALTFRFFVSEIDWRVFLKQFLNAIRPIIGQDIGILGTSNDRISFLEEELDTLRIQLQQLRDEVRSTYHLSEFSFNYGLFSEIRFGLSSISRQRRLTSSSRYLPIKWHSPAGILPRTTMR